MIVLKRLTKSDKIVIGMCSGILMLFTLIILISTVWSGFGYFGAMVTGVFSGLGLVLIGGKNK